MTQSDAKRRNPTTVKRSDAAARKARALPLLVAGKGYAEVGKALGVSARTVRAYVADPEFAERLDAARIEAREAAEQTLRDAQDEQIADAIERQRWLTSVIRGEVEDLSKNPLGNRIRAVELLGKMHGDFIDRSEVTHMGAQLSVQIVATEEEVRRWAKGD